MSSSNRNLIEHRPRPKRRNFPPVLAAVAFLVSPAVAAQEQRPLTKAELLRYLTSDTYSQDELVAVVRRSCLSFDPTTNDRADFRRLGAGPEVLAAIEACAAHPLTAILDPATLTLRAGDAGRIDVHVSRGDQPQPDLRLVLRNSDRISGTGGRVVDGVTDATGRATLRVPAGVVARAYSLPIDAPGAELTPQPILRLRVIPGAPESARLSPPYLVVDDGADSTPTVRAAVRDAFGNPVAGARLVLGDSTLGREEAASGVADGEGRVELAVDVAELRGRDRLYLRAGDRVLADLAIERRAAAGPDRDRDAPRVAADYAAEAVAVRERIVASNPDDEDARLELARARVRAGQRAAAEKTYGEILSRDPGRREAARELALLRSQPYRVELSGWGGATLREGSDPALRHARLSFRATPFQIWGRYDRSLGLDDPPLLRGPDELEGYFAGAALLWGKDRRLVTRVELGQRRDPVEDLNENVVRAEQVVRAPVGSSLVNLTVGGYLGRWFDRDDWVAYGRIEAPVGERLTVRPAVFVGETMGTNTRETGRSVERELRFLLPVAYEHPAGWRVEPGIALGDVDGESELTSGRLLEARLLLAAPIGGPHRLQVFLRNQSAPGSRAFTVVNAGLWLRLE